jgi:glycosyltransferase involved in cell wall biosynthesis
MNLLIVAASEYSSNIAIHPLSVARFMQSRGVECIVSFSGGSARPRGAWPFRICDHAETAHNGVLFPDGKGPDLVHAWTPRESVRRLTERIVARYGCPYIVHLEDNEETVFTDTVPSLDYERLERLPARIADLFVPPNLSHPKRFRWFIEESAGLTALIDTLLDFKPAGLPGVVFWPGFDDGILAARANSGAFRQALRLTPDEPVLVYTGNIHASNEAEVSALIDAVGLLRQRGVPAKLVKTGANFVALDKLKEGEEMGYVADLGFVSRWEIRSLLNIADVLVQPGHASPFNDYRFPCKLPEFLITGKPVILPATNLGRFLSDGVECLLLRSGFPEEIADRIQQLISDHAFAQRIGQAGQEFAFQNLSWEQNLEPVLKLYRGLIDEKPRSIRHADPLPVALENTPGGEGSDAPYLELAVRSAAGSSTRVTQRPDGDPALYEKWLAAIVEHALNVNLQSIQIEGWMERDEWQEATHRGYAAGLGNYLRRNGLPVSDLAVEGALREQPATGPFKRAAIPSPYIEAYAGLYRSPPIGYGTVRDYCDSCDRFGVLHEDLKAVQRPWIVKAILGAVPIGGRVLGIGAGENWVAETLAGAGYEVWIVDPKAEASSEVRFIRDTFSDELMDLPPESFDCVYSVSVLEGIDEAAFAGVARGIVRFLRPAGVSIHAIDFVQRGTGYKEDLCRLELLAAMFGIEDVELRATLHRIDRDLDVFTLSAESINRLRGSRPYDQFRMRKCVSVQFCTSARNVARNPEAADRP